MYKRGIKFIDFFRVIVDMIFILFNIENKNYINCSVNFFLMKSSDNKQCFEFKVCIWGKELVKFIDLLRYILVVFQQILQCNVKMSWLFDNNLQFCKF